MQYTRIKKPAHLINLAYFTVMLIIGLILALHYQITQASPFQDYPYQVAPRLQVNCEAKWIWSPYNILLSSRCSSVWSQLTRETILEESDYFSHL